jgi:hypothetical protein
MRPLGVPDAEWSCGYNKTFPVDGLPLVGSWGGGSYSARATARIGRLMLRLGGLEVHGKFRRAWFSPGMIISRCARPRW